jgi:hypothetical protein
MRAELVLTGYVLGAAWVMARILSNPLGPRYVIHAMQTSVWTALGFMIGIVFWPVTVAMGIFNLHVRPHVVERQMRHVRRVTLDRPGLFEPQMPALPPMCPAHRQACIEGETPCGVCGRPLHIVLCEACVRDKMIEMSAAAPRLVCTPCVRAGAPPSNVYVLERMPGGGHALLGPTGTGEAPLGAGKPS